MCARAQAAHMRVHTLACSHGHMRTCTRSSTCTFVSADQNLSQCSYTLERTVWVNMHFLSMYAEVRQEAKWTGSGTERPVPDFQSPREAPPWMRVRAPCKLSLMYACNMCMCASVHLCVRVCVRVRVHVHVCVCECAPVPCCKYWRGLDGRRV